MGSAYALIYGKQHLQMVLGRFISAFVIFLELELIIRQSALVVAVSMQHVT